MRILIVANHYPVCSARYAADAFTRLGHEVTHIGPAKGRHVWGLDLPPFTVWEPDEPPTQAPDLVVIMDSDPAILDAVKDYGATFNCPVTVWGVDNHVRDYRREHFDHYFVAHRSHPIMFWRDDMTWLPCSYDPTLHTPSAIPFTDRKYDVAMLGVMYDTRWDAVNRLRAEGLKVIAGSGLVGETYRDVYHDARVSLVVSANGDVPLRLFETAAMGCAVVADRTQDSDRLGFERDYLYTVRDMDGMVIAVKAALENPDYAARCQQWVTDKGHTWDNRAQEVIDWVNARKVAA